jgi:hypothetical protein
MLTFHSSRYLPVFGRVGDNGEPEYYARISEFLPYALENASPIKGLSDSI